jgi:hypothetical protein
MTFPIILTKPRGRYRVVFTPDPSMNTPDDPDWFIAIQYRTKKDDKLNEELIILKKEVQGWIDRYKREGYTQETI